MHIAVCLFGCTFVWRSVEKQRETKNMTCIQYLFRGYHQKARLVADASEWIEIHGETLWTGIPGFDPWRIYIDVLHVLDLAITVDKTASFLMWLTKGKDAELGRLRTRYTLWCKEMKIPVAMRANKKMWTSKILAPGTGQYPSLSQKFLKGAAARLIVFFLCEIAYGLAMERNDLYSKWLSRTEPFTCLCVFSVQFFGLSKAPWS